MLPLFQFDKDLLSFSLNYFALHFTPIFYFFFIIIVTHDHHPLIPLYTNQINNLYVIQVNCFFSLSIDLKFLTLNSEITKIVNVSKLKKCEVTFSLRK